MVAFSGYAFECFCDFVVVLQSYFPLAVGVGVGEMGGDVLPEGENLDAGVAIEIVQSAQLIHSPFGGLSPDAVEANRPAVASGNNLDCPHAPVSGGDSPVVTSPTQWVALFDGIFFHRRFFVIVFVNRFAIKEIPLFDSGDDP